MKCLVALLSGCSIYQHESGDVADAGLPAPMQDAGVAPIDGSVVTVGHWQLVSEQPNLPWAGSPLVAYDRSRGQVIWTGMNLSIDDPTFETWAFDGGQWQLVVSGGGPLDVVDPSMTYDSQLGSLVWIGGASNTPSQEWSLSGTQWVLASADQGPPARANAALAFDDAAHQLVLFGGGVDVPLGDTWVRSGDDPTWQRVAAGQQSPAARTLANMCYDAEREVVVMFGGTTEDLAALDGGYLNDTWEWNGVAWSTAHYLDNNVPYGRAYGAFAYDPTLHACILMGGDEGAAESFQDMWAWDGARWQALAADGESWLLSDVTLSFDTALNTLVMTSYAMAGATGMIETYLLVDAH